MTRTILLLGTILVLIGAVNSHPGGVRAQAPDPADLAEGMRLYQQKGTAARAMGGRQTE